MDFLKGICKMKKILGLIFLVLSISLAARGDELAPYGSWVCVMPGNKGSADLNINPFSHIFSINILGKPFNTLFKTFIVDGDKVGLILLTPDHIAHPVDIVLKGDEISVSFYDIPEIPALECKRPKEKAPVGH